ncbi:MAG: efflux RND transporter periplasmic adaptor subunit [Vitreoscilla sp.]|nr:efflux RND transporter periplasmic adaptor subunit [Burkholderiales bacterium]MBP6339295.1 efflux RND transporter periplasmic adaptor subunit [Vitreoscilla sp.]
MNNTKTIIAAVVLLALGGALGWGASHWHTSADTAKPATTTTERKVLYWYDPMVPGQKFDQPGKSPFMDMQLVPRYADEGEPVAGDAPALKVDTRASQALGTRLATVEKRSLGAAVEAVGTVGLNERDVAIVQARTSGFVERVYARAPGDVIAAGAPLVDVLNPEWLGAQQEYLAVKATGDAALTQAAKQRLVLLGMPHAMVAQVEKSGQSMALQTITAPTGGLIAELMVRAGMMVAPGMTLARINGLGTVWLEAALPEAQAASIQPGQAVQARFPSLPGQVVNGRVAAVLPEANKDSRTLRVRIELPNTQGRLKAGLFAQVSMQGAPREALVLPAEAVIRTGKRALVYVVEGTGQYRPVEVQVGEQVDEWIVIRSGLAVGQQVVASGQFLIDSEASLQGVMARSPAASSAAPAAPASYQARGVVTEIGTDDVTLEHEPVPALKWPGMTMPFKLAKPELAKGLKVGQQLSFSFIKQGDDWVITQISPLVPAPQGSEKQKHDHSAAPVIPAQAGIHPSAPTLDSRLRGNDVAGAAK